MLIPLVLALQTGSSQLVDPAVLFARETVDHRRSQSPVKDQGDRGTCAAFALCGALETFPSVPTDLCEQLLYATVKLHEQDVDGWIRRLQGPDAALTLDEGNAFGAYLPLFGLVGTCHESVWPYDPRAVKAGPDVPEELRRFLELARIGPDDLRGLRDAAGKWGFRQADAVLLDAATARDVARLKRELKEGTLAIPVGYRIHGPSWSKLAEAGAPARAGSPLGGRARVLVHPGMLHVFAEAPAEGAAPAWLPYEDARETLAASSKDLAQEVIDGRWIQGRQRPPEEYGGHAVLLVGYDADGFLAKNSWGTDWGAGGYFVVPYDYHRMYVNGGMILRSANLRPPALSPFERNQRIAGAAFRLKVQGRAGAGPAAPRELVLSTWTPGLRDPDVEVVEYAVEARGADGAWAEVTKRAVLTGPTDDRNGAPLVLAGDALTRLEGAAAVRVTARYGVDVLDRAAPSGARFVRSCTFDGVPASPPTAVDLAPRP